MSVVKIKFTETAQRKNGAISCLNFNASIF